MVNKVPKVLKVHKDSKVLMELKVIKVRKD
jgi:hypothetical protein